MAAATDAPVVESVNLAEAVAMISEAAEEPAVLQAYQEERPAGSGPAAEEAPATQEGEVTRVPAATAEQPSPDAAEERLASEAAEGSEGEPPEFWDDEDKKAWTSVPAELRPVLRKYEQQRLDFVAEKTQQATEERDEAMRVAQAANATVEQAADWWRKNGQAFHQAFVDRWSRVDWKGLAEKDPAEIGRLMQQRQVEETLLAEATRRGEADFAAAHARAEKELEEARRVEGTKLAAKLPEWFGTPQVAQRTWDDLRRYLFGKGIAADRINGVYEAPIVEIALNSMRLENAQALAQRVRQRHANPEGTARSGQRPVAAAPARVSPGPSNLPVDRAPDAVRQASERFRKSGGASIADAAELIRLSGL
jgi:hypothetical protein